MQANKQFIGGRAFVRSDEKEYEIIDAMVSTVNGYETPSYSLSGFSSPFVAAQIDWIISPDGSKYYPTGEPINKQTVKRQMTMAAPAPGELEAMYNFFNLMELLYQQDGEPEDLADEYPEAWYKQAKWLYKEHDGDSDIWKGKLIEYIFGFYSISTGWRRIVGGFDSLFTEVCDPTQKSLSYKKEIVDAVNNQAVQKRVVFPDGHSYPLPDISYKEFLHTDIWTGTSDTAYDEYLRIRGMHDLQDLSAESLNSIKVVVHYKGEAVTSLKQLEQMVEKEKEVQE